MLRCEAQRDHYCAHFNGDHWWPNTHGLPHTKHPMHYALVGWVIVAVGLAGIIWKLLKL
jgi:hypothetical protein